MLRRSHSLDKGQQAQSLKVSVQARNHSIKYKTLTLSPSVIMLLYLLYTSYHIIGFLPIGILYKNSCENLLNLPLDKKLGAPQSSARRQSYHIQGTLSIVKVNKKKSPKLGDFSFSFLPFQGQ